jgi:hypothetical protein
MHPVDVFLKNTQEVLGPLNTATAHSRLTRLEFLAGDGTVRQTTYGSGDDATIVVVNFSAKEAQVKSRLGGEVVLPAWGFIVESPRFLAFYALRWAGQDYDRGALFTVRPLDDKNLEQSLRVHIFHAFGPSTIRWKGADYNVQREATKTPQ